MKQNAASHKIVSNDKNLLDAGIGQPHLEAGTALGYIE
jgi:hypothetical protein